MNPKQYAWLFIDEDGNEIIIVDEKMASAFERYFKEYKEEPATASLLGEVLNEN